MHLYLKTIKVYIYINYYIYRMIFEKGRVVSEDTLNRDGLLSKKIDAEESC